MLFKKSKVVYFFQHSLLNHRMILTGGEIWGRLTWITGSSYPLEEVREQNVKQRNPLPLPSELHANLLWKLCDVSFSRA